MAFNVDFLASYDIDSLAAELRRIAGLTGKNTVTSGDITHFGRVNLATIYLKFGSIGNANKAAGLAFPSICGREPSRRKAGARSKRISEDMAYHFPAIPRCAVSEPGRRL
jgi:hypothetical protein